MWCSMPDELGQSDRPAEDVVTIDLDVMFRGRFTRLIVTDAMVERGRLAGEAWFAEHQDGASTDDEWRDCYRAVLDAALNGGE